MEKLLADSIYVIEDYDELCDALRQVAARLSETDPGYHYFYATLKKALRGDLCMGDIRGNELFNHDDNVIKALTKIHLRSSINLMLDKARRA
jgi:hypothetical protein